MKIVAYGQGSAGAGVAARRWRAGREVTGRGRVGDDRGSREGSPAGRWTLAAVCLGTCIPTPTAGPLGSRRRPCRLGWGLALHGKTVTARVRREEVSLSRSSATRTQWSSSHQM